MRKGFLTFATKYEKRNLFLDYSLSKALVKIGHILLDKYDKKNPCDFHEVI